VTSPGPGTSTNVALVLEAVVTALFVILISAVATDAAPWSGVNAPIAIGGFIATAAMIIGPVSGGSFNPARSLAPAIFSPTSPDLWIYMVGPFVGGAVGGGIYLMMRSSKAAGDEANDL